ncbi:cytochrome c oxidase assembly protein COX18, mitochondrial [Uranotaenia lowii]|uniref:cytochrome c oxidase assembly protein COX18, mitochondrial n=1 Tax=Uranotaenia lowii TaxID=190385 RepID=UPI00247ACBB6|nr:cytochrome c oxidase assembly protein COX18, mitochondrial [Uranotaenia lowii]XP_055606875.1 cytochrome c oxidase assembly protein COX18, mitochondrial [Uranotaenia lowii]
MSYLKMIVRPRFLESVRSNGILFAQCRRNFSYEATVTGMWTTLSQSTPVAYVQQGLVAIHDYSGLPWWASVIVSTVLLRSVVTLPLTVYQNKIVARLEKITLEMPDIVKELKKETAVAMRKFHWTEKEARIMYNTSLKKQWDKLVVRENCHPAKTMIVLWGQIPLWVIMSVSIRNLVHMLPDPSSIEAQVAFTELTLGGFGWIPNLTEVDQSLILPVAMGLINLVIIEIQNAARAKEPSKLQKMFTNVFRGVSVLMVPVAATVPSCLCLYWVTSSACGLAQNLLTMSPRFKRLVGVPQVPSEIARPYSHIRTNFSNRIDAILGKVGLSSK